MVLASIGWTGCSSSDDEISPGLFLAPAAATEGGAPAGLTILAHRLEFLSALRPGSTEEDLMGVPAESFVLGHLSVHDQAKQGDAGEVSLSDDLLLLETKSRSILSVTLCGDSPSADCAGVTLHYDARGLDDAQIDQGSSIATTVTPIKLKNGWFLAFDGGTRNILAFRREAPRFVNGRPLAYRGFSDNASPNFANGNGLLLSVVTSGDEILTQLGLASEAIVTRFVELEENRVLVFFSNVPAVHLLELREEQVEVDFDFESEDPSDLLSVGVLKGTIKLFPLGPADPLGGQVPFLSYERIASVVLGKPIALIEPLDVANVLLGVFQPVLIPSEGGVLAFDQGSSSFLVLAASRQGQEITGGLDPVVAIPPAALLLTLLQANGGKPAVPPFQPEVSFYHPTRPEICFFEETGNHLLAYDYAKPASSGNLRIFLTAAGIQSRRDPSGGSRPAPGVGPLAEPMMIFAVADVRDNRLFFNHATRELLSVSYTSSAAVLVESAAQTLTALGETGDFNYLEPAGDTKVRIFDRETNSLLNLELKYTPQPIRVE